MQPKQFEYTYFIHTVFLIEFPYISIRREFDFIRSDPVRINPAITLSGHCTYRQHWTHIDLKPIFPNICGIFGFPWSSLPLVPEPSTWCIEMSSEGRACCHSAIWYFVSILYTDRLTHWEKDRHSFGLFGDENLGYLNMFKKLERAYWKKKQKKWNVTNQQITTTQSNHYLLPEVGEGFWEIIWFSGGMERGWGGGGSQSSHIEYKGGIVED